MPLATYRNSTGKKGRMPLFVCRCTGAKTDFLFEKVLKTAIGKFETYRRKPDELVFVALLLGAVEYIPAC